MKKRYLVAGLLGAALIWPVAYIEGTCKRGEALEAPYSPLLSQAKDQRPEARTYLTYPEWHIVYSADSLARHLKSNPPSAYPYTQDIAAFWTSWCALNRVADQKAAGDAKVMLYTIGYSFSLEMAVKAVYENTIGRLSEAIGGHDSSADRYAQQVQAQYGAFMHETPWYAFPFGSAFSHLWALGSEGLRFHERRLALSLEYGVKTGYAGLIGWASGTALGADERTMRVILDAPPEQVLAVDPRLKPVGNGVYDVPRYAQFTDIAQKLAAAGIAFREIAGNDDIFITFIAPPTTATMAPPLLFMNLPDEAGMERHGISVKVANLSDTLRSLPRGARLEHIYDY